MNWFERSFDYLTYFTYLLYIVLFLGLWSQAPDYLNSVNYWRQILIGFLLIYFFNPFQKTKCTEFHRKVAFTSGIFILGASTLTQILKWPASMFSQYIQ